MIMLDIALFSYLHYILINNLKSQLQQHSFFNLVNMSNGKMSNVSNFFYSSSSGLIFSINEVMMQAFSMTEQTSCSQRKVPQNSA